MNKKIVIILFFVLVLTGFIFFVIVKKFSSNDSKTLGLFESSEYLKTSNYHIYFPEKHDKKTFDLIFLQTVGGEEREIADLMNRWKKVANENNWALAAQFEVGTELGTQVVMSNALQEIKKKYSIGKVFITGFSGGGYRSCYFAFENPEMIDGIIPMGAYCDKFSVDEVPIKKLPMLSVVGEKDTWARGDDFKSIDEANVQWSKVGFKQDVIVVPDIGHNFPVQAMDSVVSWILKQ
jgi:predicted esterase